eukprot:5622824-Pyramimonas_sp.AAC.1
MIDDKSGDLPHVLRTTCRTPFTDDTSRQDRCDNSTVVRGHNYRTPLLLRCHLAVNYKHALYVCTTAAGLAS